MKPLDTLRFATHAATGYPLRTALMVLAMSIGVAAVVVLTALGDGARRYVVNEFASLGTNLIIVLPGRSETGGFNPANVITGTPRDLTVEDGGDIVKKSQETGGHWLAAAIRPLMLLELTNSSTGRPLGA